MVNGDGGGIEGGGGGGGGQLDIVLRLMNTLKFYPLIFLLSWLPSSIFRLLEDSNPNSLNHQPLLISFFTVFKGSCIQGILDAIAYGSTPAVRKAWYELYLHLKDKKNLRPFLYDSFNNEIERNSTDRGDGDDSSHVGRGDISSNRNILDSSFEKSICDDDGSSYSVEVFEEGTLTTSLITQ